MGRRILITGVDTFWGSRVAKALESHPWVDLVIGLGPNPPKVELEKTEYVPADSTYSVLQRMVRATQVDTIVHSFMVVDSKKGSPKDINEINIIGTMNLLAAAGGTSSPVKQVVMKSSSLVYPIRRNSPNCFRESYPVNRNPQTPLERSIIEAEGFVRDFAEDNPGIAVSMLRFANVLGTDIKTAITNNLRNKRFPIILGFDPLVNFVEEDDVVRAIEHAVLHNISGVYNVCGDRAITFLELLRFCDAIPIFIPPTMTRLVGKQLARAGLVELPQELYPLLRYGRVLANELFKETGFIYRYTTRGAVDNFIKSTRLKKSLGNQSTEYRYQKDLEKFFLHSPAVK